MNDRNTVSIEITLPIHEMSKLETLNGVIDSHGYPFKLEHYPRRPLTRKTTNITL